MRQDVSLWTEAPTPVKKPKSIRWEIFRAPVGKTARLVCMSTRHFSVMTHYWKRRTIPCLQVACDPCVAKREARWTGFFLARDYSTPKTLLIQFTDFDCDELLQVEAQTGTLRGIVVNLFRNAKRNNGSVSLRVETSRIDERMLMPEDNIRDICARMWEVKLDNDEGGALTPMQLEVARQVARQAGEQITSSDDAAWMLHRAQDLAGQKVIPFAALENTASLVNGHSRH